MELNVGDYVRIHGYIDKIININDFREPSMKYALEQPSWNDDVIFIGEEDITKSSPNIIDLIEVGDYVNGYKVESVNTEYAPYGVYIEIPFVESESIGCNIDLIRTEEIKSIVTKEQFEAMQYVVRRD